jgi:hypothetical protein
MQIDTERNHIVEWAAEAAGRSSAAVVQRLTVRQFETLDQVPGHRWEFTAPSDARSVNFHAWSGELDGGHITVRALSDAVAAVQFPLWGWPEGDGALFQEATVPNSGQLPSMGLPGVEEAILRTGNAVRLIYDRPGTGTWELLEGPLNVLRFVYQSNVPTWSRSEERSVVIGGTERSCWLMFDDVGPQSVICDLEQTLLVVEPTGTQEPDKVLAVLGELIRLKSQSQ